MKIAPGDRVLAVLHSPREKLFGTLEEITAAGVFLRGMDLEYFDDWCRAVASGEPHLPMNDLFLPLWRLEKLARDEPGSGIEPLAEQFARLTGRDLDEM
jgi:hypothetical protein